MNSSRDVIIIGAGIVGASIALQLARRGYRTLNLDKNAVAGAGSTVNSCAIVRTYYSTLDGTAIAYESYLHWKRWPAFLGIEDERGHARLIETGMLILLASGGDPGRHLDHHRALGIPYEQWDVDTLARRMPLLDTQAYYPPRRPDDEGFAQPTGDRLAGAVYMPAAGYVNDPQLAVHNLQCAAEAHGATFRFRAAVNGIRRSSGRVCGVTLAGGETIDAPVVVNAAGPHSAVINRLAGIEQAMNIRTRALRHEVDYVPAPEDYDAGRHGFVIGDDDIGGYCRPEVGNKLLVGSLDPACDPKEWVDNPDDFNRNITDEQWRAQLYRQALRMPSLPIPGQASGVVDLYDVSDDWIPVYDRTDLDGFYLAIGTSGNQFKNAPMIGVLMAELIDACENGRDHDNEPVAFHCPLTGVDLSIGFYSRNRDVVTDSSFTVMG